ncbi:uncharacterized protein L969DRAFT_364761 [Mixia osmundae IAM 14324]|uniref:uncharacterized protein n=1 Tax=Mixia osmundae (strain CBS 9802 / IAM 14324 / JCM 22182 / KY 12970) TaxID=764103 RepID=UPI0004A5539D|nr:uncharacterized protein L969DRAFT_364761 [Mixia osmundae IAM 14324]KEI40963.1 hypothetical protein L969DRAFT_364761 [Mixia osmundae IAM 14324]
MDSPEQPIDSILWIHMMLQMLVWGIMFPAGMVLGMTKSRWHVPMQATATLLTIMGVILAHRHGGRQFPFTAHAAFAKYVFFYMLGQAGAGIYLKAHIHERSLRPYVQRLHSIAGRTFPIVGWVQMVLGVIAALGTCTGEHFGQCLAHIIMGSSFVGYGVLLLLMAHFGRAWLARKTVSQEFIDSATITVWGIVNALTEHDFLGHGNGTWPTRDMQHVGLGVLWACGGAVGVWLSRSGKRSVLPGIIIAMTGFAMSGHAQPTMLATEVHKAFGYVLMLAGLTKIIECCFDTTRATSSDPTDYDGTIAPFAHLTPLLLTIAGTIFLSAAEDQLDLIISIGMDHVTYIIGQFSVAFLIYLVASVMISLYNASGNNSNQTGNGRPVGSPGSSVMALFARLKGDAPRSTTNSHLPGYQAVDIDLEDAHRSDPSPGETVFDAAEGRVKMSDLDDDFWQDSEEEREAETRHT